MEIKSYAKSQIKPGNPGALSATKIISRLQTAVCRFPDLQAFRQMEERHYKAIYLALQQRGDLFWQTDELKLIGVGTPDVSIPVARLPVVLGSGEQADVRVPGKGISGVHLRLGYEDGLVRLEDLGSKNGTYVNGQKVSSVNLYAGDDIAIGLVRLIVTC